MQTITVTIRVTFQITKTIKAAKYTGDQLYSHLNIFNNLCLNSSQKTGNGKKSKHQEYCSKMNTGL